MSASAGSYGDRDELFDAFGHRVSRGKAQLYRELGLDVVMGTRDGPFFWDAFDGRRFWNCHCNGGVFNLGHRNEKILTAVTSALGELDIGNHHLVSPYRATLAERLAQSTGGALECAVFGVSGGEAIDLAVKLARASTGRTTIISVQGGYHGHTGLALAMGDAEYRDPFGPNLPGFAQVPFDDIAALEQAVDDSTAAVVLEPIPATLGMPIPSEGYLARVQTLCADRGARFVLDEVQTGLGRTGHSWYFMREGLRPDIVVTGKGLSGGVYPITATMMTPEIHRFFDDHPFAHISTFGGADPGCAAAISVLDQIEQPGFLERVNEQGARIEAGLSGLPFSVRRSGMMMGFAFPMARAGMFAAKVLYDAGVFSAWSNNDDSVVQFLPPLILSDGQVDELIGVVRAAFS